MTLISCRPIPFYCFRKILNNSLACSIRHSEIVLCLFITLISRKGAYKSQACRAFGNMAAEFAASCTNNAPAPKARPARDPVRSKEPKFSTGEV